MVVLVRQIGPLIARGTRSAVYAYGRDAVVKIPDAATPPLWIEREAEYCVAVRAAGAPTPRLLDVEIHDGRPSSVWERVRGPSMWQSARDRPELCADYGEMLGKLHLGLFELVPPIGLPRHRDRLTSKLRTAASSVDATLVEITAGVPQGAGPPRVCHGDLHPGNVILSAQGPVVVDWFDASTGEPLADVARSHVLMRLGRDGYAPDHLPGATPAALGDLAEAHLRTVREGMGFSQPEFERWCAVEALARVAEGVPAAGLIELWDGGRRR